MQMILKKSRYKRTLKEVEIIKRTCEDFHFIEKFKNQVPQHAFDDLFRVIRYERYINQRTIFNYGDLPRNCYIILKGEVLVLVPVEEREFYALDRAALMR